MQKNGCAKGRSFFVAVGVVLVGMIVAGIASCKGPGPEGRSRFGFRKSDVGWPKGVTRWQGANYPAVKVAVPQVAEAEFVNDDSICATCHETYVKKFESNVHRQQKCEGCHGPASRHVQTRGQEPGLILSFKTLPAAQKSELCLKCHEKAHEPGGGQWRTSAHAHKGLACTDCHRGHYNVPPGTPATETAGVTNPHGSNEALLEVAETGDDAVPDLEGFVFANSRTQRFDVGRRSAGISSLMANLRRSSTKSPTELPPPGLVVRAQEPSQQPSQTESLRGTSHFMGAIAPQVCYRCHSEMRDLESVAHPHQVCGRNKFNCTTCHDPHGNIRMETRRDVCLECHKGAPTMAWHSSTHNLNDVACTDCHNPHPRAKVEEFINVSHTSIDRVKRMPMSVDEPAACYKCHPQIYAKNSMPSHHPIKEGKMVCSACHDAHGQAHGNLKDAATVNMVCYKCHAEKQGPFAYEHPPVTENCAICHEPHGTVANNMLRQPPNFLCLRCHTGHRTSPLGPNHAQLLGDVGNSKILQQAFYTDCTQCHHEIHGSDLPSPHVPHAFMR